MLLNDSDRLNKTELLSENAIKVHILIRIFRRNPIWKLFMRQISCLMCDAIFKKRWNTFPLRICSIVTSNRRIILQLKKESITMSEILKDKKSINLHASQVVQTSKSIQRTLTC